MKKTGKQNIRWNTMKILAVGFLSVIFLGAVLLWLPVSNEKSISFLDALFTSTSSVCVTGLVTIVPKYQFTITGKVILLILIQIGGLGVIACITAFFMLLKRKITVKERVVIQEAYNMNSLGGLVGLVRKILIGTVVVRRNWGRFLRHTIYSGLWGCKRNLVWNFSFNFCILQRRN